MPLYGVASKAEEQRYERSIQVISAIKGTMFRKWGALN
jgi:hypothetical protein